MDTPAITPEAISAQQHALLRQKVGMRVFRMSLDAQSAAAMQLIRMMNQSAGIGTAIDTSA